MEIIDVARQFKLDGEIVSCEPYGNGHINRTYLVKTANNDYILQRINTIAFKDVDLLMNNIFYVTNYLMVSGIESMKIVNTKEDKLYFKNDEGCYRVYIFNAGTVAYEKIDSMDLIETTAFAFANFHKNLKGLDVNKIGDIIPNFHNTQRRYMNFLEALKEDKYNLRATCEPEIAAIEKYKEFYSLIVDALNNKDIPTRITHNDPKLNNILFDAKDNSVRVVIDLDTIMTGSALYDIGDANRSLLTGDNEDNKNLDEVTVDLEITKHYLIGYFRAMGKELTEKEIELIPYAPFLMTIECGIRFLEDYLRGNVYFHVKYPEHNLIRCRTQLKIASTLMDNIESIKAIVKEIAVEK